MDVLQLVGGVFYLLNKVFFSLKERASLRGEGEIGRKWQVWAWGAYLIGLPAWVIILAKEQNWIAASVEASGFPGMLLGLVMAITGGKKPLVWLDRLAIVCIPIGFGYSLYDFGGFTEVSQWLETGLVLGFLIGTYLLARDRAGGYLWCVLMHVSCGWLMWTQGYYWLFWQQIASLLFIFDAYIMSRRKEVVGSTVTM